MTRSRQLRVTKTEETKRIATLNMVVTYDTVPSECEIAELLEKARELGGVDRATFTIHRSVKRELA